MRVMKTWPRVRWLVLVLALAWLPIASWSQVPQAATPPEAGSGSPAAEGTPAGVPPAAPEIPPAVPATPVPAPTADTAAPTANAPAPAAQPAEPAAAVAVSPEPTPAAAPVPVTAPAAGDPTPAAPVPPAATPAAPAVTAAPVAAAAPPASTPVATTASPAVAAGASAEAASGEEGEGAEHTGSWIRWERANVLVIILVLLGFVSFFTFSAQRGKQLFIRRIGGLAAVDDAIGRATEMGKPVLFVPGIMDMDDIQTIAGVTILGHVAKKTAEYETPLWAPMTRSFTMSVAQEVVKQSYLEKGRADAFRADRINYLTDDQFGFVAGVGGIMMRERPAACFYLGTFYAESLILAETGNSVGAIQIAGTAEPSQIPFFVAACDYTLIGEELFAASAYLSRNPQEVGSLKGQDMSKIMIMAAILVGTIAASIAPKAMSAPAPKSPDPKQIEEPKTLLEQVAEKYLKAFRY